MSAKISVSNDGRSVILSVNGQKLRLSKDGAFDLAEALKRNALKAGENSWQDFNRGFPDIFKRG